MKRVTILCAMALGLVACHGEDPLAPDTEVVSKGLAKANPGLHIVEVDRFESASDHLSAANQTLCGSGQAPAFAYRAIDNGKVTVGVACLENDRTITVVLHS